MRALVRLVHPEMRPGTSGQSGKTVPTYFTDPEVDASTIAPGSEIWTQPSMDRPHWNEILDALQEDVNFCEDRERRQSHAMGRSPFRVFSTSPTMVRRQLKRTRYRRYYCRLDQLSDILGSPRGSQCCTEIPKFLRPQKRCKWQSSGTAHEALEHSTAEIAHEVCKMSKTWTLVSRVSRRKSRTTQPRKVRSTCNEIWGKLKRVHHCSKAHGTKTFLSLRFLDIRHSRPWRSPVGHRCSRGTRRETAT